MIWLIFKVAPKYGHVHPAIYLSITALVGAYLVTSAQGFGAAIIYSVTNWETDNQFLLWPFYPLAAFVVLTVIFQINYLNKALENFSASIVTPLNFVFFSFATIITTSVLYQGFNVDSASAGLTIALGFFVIVIGVILLFQYNLKQNNMTLSRHIEDVNDEELETDLISDNPFLLLSETYPFHRKEKEEDMTAQVMKTRRKSNKDDLLYIRKEESMEKISSNPALEFRAPKSIPVVSISEQMQRRNELIHQSIERSKYIEDSNAKGHYIEPFRNDSFEKANFDTKLEEPTKINKFEDQPSAEPLQNTISGMGDLESDYDESRSSATESVNKRQNSSQPKTRIDQKSYSKRLGYK